MSTVRKHDHEIPPMSKERAREIQALSDDEVDFSDIPELDEGFFKNAKLIKRQPKTEAISIRVDTDTLEWFRATAKNDPEIRGYQTLINDVLRTYVTHQTKNNG
ncbi:MAG: BrnA antitoxin family protein [Cyanobacteria bacterium P01_G01_bin.39]